MQEASDRLTELMQADEPSEAVLEESEAEETGLSVIGNWLRSAVGLASQAPQSKQAAELEQAQELVSTLYQQRSDFMESEATGFVWLYLQK